MNKNYMPNWFFKKLLGSCFVTCALSTPIYAKEEIDSIILATSFLRKRSNIFIYSQGLGLQDTKQIVYAPYFSNFENLYFDNFSSTFFVVGRGVELKRSFNISDERGCFWKQYPPSNIKEPVIISGTTIIALESRGTPSHSTHFFHFLEHLLGIWMFGGEKNRLDVKLFILAGNGIDIPQTWGGATDIAESLIKALFPNAAIKTWNDFINETKGEVVCFKKIITSDRSMEIFKKEPYYTQRMLGGYFQDLTRESLECLVAYVWQYFKVKKTVSEKLVVTYTKRKSSRCLDLGCEQELIDKITKLPHVELQIVDFASISFQEQVQLIANTDVLLGVHGNGLSHALFLPNGATLIEFFPKNSLRAEYRIFAQLRGLNYFGWMDEKGWIDNKVAETVGCYGEVKVQEGIKIDANAIIDILKKINYL